MKGAQTTALLRSWYAAGGDLFLDYDLCGAWGNSGYWGLAPDLGYDVDADPLRPTAEAYPKWGAIKEIASGPRAPAAASRETREDRRPRRPPAPSRRFGPLTSCTGRPKGSCRR